MKNKSKYFCLFFLLTILRINGQNNLAPEYNIITEVISMDTIPDEYFPRILHMKIVRGKITKEDSIKSILRFGKTPLLLIKKATNKFAQEKLAKQYLDSEEIAKYIGRDLLLDVIERIPPNQNHPDALSANKITIVSKKPKHKTHHHFSTPFLIEKGKFMIYHSKLIARGVGKSEFIIYCVKADNSIEIEKTFVLWEHGAN